MYCFVFWKTNRNTGHLPQGRIFTVFALCVWLEYFEIRQRVSSLFLIYVAFFLTDYVRFCYC